MFKRKPPLSDKLDDQLIRLLTQYKNQWLNQKRIVEGSIEPSDEVIYQLRLVEAKYLFLLKEARMKKSIFDK